MMRPQPMIVVRDVQAASRWFQDVLALRSAHGGDEYEMLMDGEDLVLQLHRWDAHEHPHLGDEQDASRGNGVLLWFATDQFEELLRRVEKANAKVVDGPLYNANGRQHEIWLQAPEGFRVVVAGPRDMNRKV
ncbi:MAG: VOC family protein [Polyangiaceae bacterium]